MAESTATLESLDQHGCGVRIVFEKQGDRFGHTIFSVSSESTQAAFSSVEGAEGESNPSSPPFQELHQQDQTLFLTGATTRGHWSMSVTEVVVTENALSSRLLDKRYGLNEPEKRPEMRSYIVFEVACRLKATYDRLGSLYQGLGGEYVTTGDDIMTLSTSPPLFFGSVALSEKKECYVRPMDGDMVDATQFQIRPSYLAPESFPCTIQWRYGVYWL